MTANRVAAVAALTVLWVVLWRDVSVANVLSGIAASGFVVWVMRLETGGRRPATHRVRPLALVSFVGYFAVKLVESNLYLAREVVTPTNSIETGIIAVPLERCSDMVTTIVGNCVSLTPGTLTLEVHRGETPTLFVHVLHLRDVEEARSEVIAMLDKARAAFPLREVSA